VQLVGRNIPHCNLQFLNIKCGLFCPIFCCDLLLQILRNPTLKSAGYIRFIQPLSILKTGSNRIASGPLGWDNRCFGAIRGYWVAQRNGPNTISFTCRPTHFFLPDDKYGAFFQIFGPITNVIWWDGLSRLAFIYFFYVAYFSQTVK